MDVLSILLAVALVIFVVRSVRRIYGTPRPRKPSMNSGVAEKAALGGLLAALFFTAGRHNNRKDYWT